MFTMPNKAKTDLRKRMAKKVAEFRKAGGEVQRGRVAVAAGSGSTARLKFQEWKPAIYAH